MYLADAPLTAREVLSTFHQDEAFLFLGAAFTTVGLVAGAFGLLRRRFDKLLLYFAIFSFFYGQRLWLMAHLLTLTLGNNEFFFRLREVVSFLVPIPGLLFFQASGFFGKRSKFLVGTLTAGFVGLALATIVFGYYPRQYNWFNSTLAIVPFLWLAPRLFRREVDRDFAAIRPGLIIFALCLLRDNILGAFEEPRFRIEPFAFAVLVGSLGYVAARRTLERDEELGGLRNELELARRIQLSILPGAFPPSRAFAVAARYVPMTSVAGDFYDYLAGDDEQAGLLIADVSGHGVPAALIASMVKMAASSQRALAAEPDRVLAGMNAALYGNTQQQFVTAAYVHLDARAAVLRYAAAGHPAMMLLRENEVVEVMENALVLGLLPEVAYTCLEFALRTGDRLVLYTDGLVEASNASDEMLGDGRLMEMVKETAAMTPAQAADTILVRVQGWGRVQEDDLTVLICDYRGVGDNAA